MTENWVKLLQGLIALNGFRGTHWPFDQVPDEIVAGLRVEENQARVVKLGNYRFVVYLTRIGSEDVVAIDLLQ